MLKLRETEIDSLQTESPPFHYNPPGRMFALHTSQQTQTNFCHYQSPSVSYHTLSLVENRCWPRTGNGTFSQRGSVDFYLPEQPRQKKVYVRPVGFKKTPTTVDTGTKEQNLKILCSLQKMHKDLFSESVPGEDVEQVPEKVQWMLDVKLPGVSKTNRREMCMAGCNGMSSEVTHVCRECCNYLCQFCAAEHMSSDENMYHQIVTWLLLFCIMQDTHTFCVHFFQNTKYTCIFSPPIFFGRPRPFIYIFLQHTAHTCIFDPPKSFDRDSI